MKTSGNTILITGGASGIGLALAKEFLVRNNLVIICDLKKESLASVKKEFPEMGTILCDVNSPRHRERLLKTIKKDFPNLNILVNNAGVVFWHNFLLPEPNLAEQILLEVNTNLLAPIELTRMFLPQLLKRENSSFINISSGLAYVPLAQEPVYCATKSGFHSFTQSIRYQLKDTPIQVMEVLSSWVDTDMARNVDTSKLTPERVAAEVIKGMEGDQEEIHIGRIGLLYFLSRLAPHWILKKLNDNTPPHKV